MFDVKQPPFYFLRDMSETSTSNTTKVPFSKSNDETQDKLLLQPMLYLLQIPGKNVRKKLLSAFNVWTRVEDDKVRQIGELVQMLHNASLLLDDIEDNSVLRRGQPVAHKVYGIPSTINSANYVMFIGLERVLDLDHPQAVHVFCQQMLELHRGQGIELYWRDNPDFQCPTEEEYEKMTIQKTGGLFNLGVRLMQLFSKDEHNYEELTSLLGLYFQIRDDYANLCLEDYSVNKSFAEDLTEGKLSFPIIHAIRSHPEDTQIKHILRQRTTDLELKKYCVSLLDKYGSFAYSRERLEKLDKEIREKVAKLGGNDFLIKLMDDLKNWK